MLARAWPWLLAALGLACARGPEPTEPLTSEAVAIRSFAVSAASLSEGETLEVSWRTDGAIALHLQGLGQGPLSIEGAAVREGSVSDRPGGTTTYRLIAVGVDGDEVTATATVEQRPRPPEATLQLTPSRVALGETMRLGWTSAHATRLLLRQEPSTLPPFDGSLSGELDLIPQRTATLELIALGPGGITTTTAQVEVEPRIVAFAPLNPSPGRLPPGARIEIGWEIEGADEVTLSSDGGESLSIPAADREAGRRWIVIGSSGVIRLAARRGPTEASRTWKAELLGPPIILEATVSPSGTTASPSHPIPISFRWKVEDATSVELEAEPGGAIDLAEKSVHGDSVEFEVRGETTLRFVARSPRGASERELMVAYVPPPTIETFVARPARVGVDEPFELSWTTRNASFLTLDASGAKRVVLANNGSLRAKIGADVAYRLEAINSTGIAVSDELQVTVGPPVVDTFTFEQRHVAPGGLLDLRWSNRGGTSLIVEDPWGMAVAACTSQSLSTLAAGGCTFAAPSATGVLTYRMILTNGVGDRTNADATIRVTAGPWIESFEAAVQRLTQGEAFSLSWQIDRGPGGSSPSLRLVDDLGDTYSLQGKDPLRDSILITSSYAGARTFTLTASDDGGASHSATAVVDVLPPPAVRLTATPANFDPSSHTDVILSWESDDAVSLVLHRLDPAGRPQAPPLFQTSAASVIASGSYSVAAPTQPETRFRAEVRNAAGGPSSSDATVVLASPEIVSFTATPRSAAGTSTLSWVTRGGGISFSPALEVSTVAPFVDVFGATETAPMVLGPCDSYFSVADEGCGDLDFPNGFSFPYDGAIRDGARVFVNGFLGFDTTSPLPGGTFTVRPLPAPLAPYVHVAPYWADLQIPALPGSGIFYRLGWDPVWGRQLILQWRGMGPYPGYVASYDFQAVLFESGTFDVRYGAMNSSTSSTRGWQNTAATVAIDLAPRLAVGGPSHRSFRNVVDAPPVGSIEVDVRQTTSFELKVTAPGGSSAAASRVVTVWVP